MSLLVQADNFVVLGQPDCRPDTVDILLIAAEEYTADTRVRIKATMERLKEQGVPLGSSRPGATAGADALRKHFGKGSKLAGKMRAQRAEDYYQFVMPRIVEMRKQGVTHNAIANILNEEGLTMQNGGPYHEVAILRLKRRWEAEHGKIAEEFDRPGRRRKCS
jgi:DNA invertase Pin-like site-specific DNA recombinase